MSELAETIAHETGVPASALRGTTRDELEAHAAELLALGITPTTKELTPEQIVAAATGR